ncbi:MAG: hypothetical protein ACOX4R_05255 [Lentihominibacter sp.]|jgi:glycopeptide antibiotics resistance protein
MEWFLSAIVSFIAKIHDAILTINDQSDFWLNDKQLHFVVIGIVGILLVFCVHPVFLWLSRSGHTMVISFLYVLTVIVVLTFAIEIGQWATGTGAMEFADIAMGIVGFLAAFAIFGIIREMIHFIRRKINERKKRFS